MLPNSRDHILIVGGSSGAGRAAARRFQAAGYVVSIISRRPPVASMRLRGAFYWSADISLTEELGSILRNVIVKNGALSAVAFFQRYRGEGDQWRGEMQTSLFGTKNVIDALVRHAETKNCSIVVVSSVNAWLISKNATVGYHVAKACVNELVRVYAAVLAPLNIRLNSVSPGTFIKKETRRFFAEAQELTLRRARLIPLRRLGAAEEVADAVFFLASKNSSVLTGQNIVVDGGLSLVYQEDLVRRPTNDLNAAEPFENSIGRSVTARSAGRRRIAPVA